MRPYIRGLLGCLMFGLLGLAGCQLEHPLDEQHKWEMKKNETRFWSHPGLKKVQQVKISVTSKPFGSTVRVAVVPTELKDKAKEALAKGDQPPNYYDYHEGGEKVEFKINMPKEEPFTVIIRNTSDESVSAEFRATTRP